MDKDPVGGVVGEEAAAVEEEGTLQVVERVHKVLAVEVKVAEQRKVQVQAVEGVRKVLVQVVEQHMVPVEVELEQHMVPEEVELEQHIVQEEPEVHKAWVWVDNNLLQAVEEAVELVHKVRVLELRKLKTGMEEVEVEVQVVHKVQVEVVHKVQVAVVEHPSVVSCSVFYHLCRLLQCYYLHLSVLCCFSLS